MKFALEQLKALSLNPARPLIISDADEVILHFTSLLSEFLLTKGMYVTFTSYSLEGNIKYRESDEAVDNKLLKELIEDYFENNVDNQPVVEGAKEHLGNLSEFCDIIILTNIPHVFADRRREKLAQLGINYPMISSSGPKGPILKAIQKRTAEKLVFIDDISHHHTSVAEYVPETLRIQYIANQELSNIEKKATHSHHRCDEWCDIESVVREYIK